MTASHCEDYQETSRALLTPKGRRFVKSVAKLVFGTLIAGGLAYGAHFGYKTVKFDFTRSHLESQKDKELLPWSEGQEQRAIVQVIGPAGIRDTSLFIDRDWAESTTTGQKNECREEIIFSLSEKVGQGSYLKFVDIPPPFSGNDYSESSVNCKLVLGG